jgi:hypothetical protein
MLYLKLAWSYIRALYRTEPALINSGLAALIGVALNQIAKISVPTDVLIGYVALILSGGVVTRQKVTAPANLVPPDLDLGDAGKVHVPIKAGE